MGVSRYLLVGEERRSHIGDWLLRHLWFKGDVLQAFRERAGVVFLLGVSVPRGDGACLRLEREVDVRRAFMQLSGNGTAIAQFSYYPMRPSDPAGSRRIRCRPQLHSTYRPNCLP